MIKKKAIIKIYLDGLAVSKSRFPYTFAFSTCKNDTRVYIHTGRWHNRWALVILVLLMNCNHLLVSMQKTLMSWHQSVETMCLYLSMYQWKWILHTCPAKVTFLVPCVCWHAHQVTWMNEMNLKPKTQMPTWCHHSICFSPTRYNKLILYQIAWCTSHICPLVWAQFGHSKFRHISPLVWAQFGHSKFRHICPLVWAEFGHSKLIVKC